MRYAKGHKDTSHERIVTVAAKNFRRLGIAAAGMTGIMAEAGLTNGGFYSHFRSKSDLVREGLERALDEQLQSLSEADVVPGELNQRIRSSLSSEHPVWRHQSQAPPPDSRPSFLRDVPC
jgi:TetR/AcrR family transcriptional regulator, transcriptional repressor for nem operon